jgi:predicted small secreted protein
MMKKIACCVVMVSVLLSGCGGDNESVQQIL